MTIRLCASLASVALLLAICVPAGVAGGQERNPQDVAALQKNAEAFVAAFQKGDFAALAVMWTTDGDYTTQSGKTHNGRDAIEKAFTSLFADNKDLKLRIDSGALRFVTPDVAVEDGITSVIPPDGGPPSRTRYTIVHVKKDGQWLLSSVREAVFAPPTNFDNLKDLEWLIGDWAGDSDKEEVARAAYSWSPSQNFILSAFTTTFKNTTMGGGNQWIGWDAAAKRVRSWTFEENGGFGEGAWTKEGNSKWIVNTKAVLQGGKMLVATIVINRVDADTISWQAKERVLDGANLPDGKEIKFKRVK